MRNVIPVLVLFLVAREAALAADAADVRPRLCPVVEIEEDVYQFEPADNGSSPMWCYGSTCLVRLGDDVFASGIEALPNAKPLNNIRWTLWKRGSEGWELQQADPKDRTREPCPIAGFADGRLLMSVNPTIQEDPDARSGPARPEILQFSAADCKGPFKTLLPDWKEKPAFTEHSYRSFAADGPRGELILFHNIGYSHSQWAFLDRDGNWSATGKLVWPKRDDPKFAPYNSTLARVNYPNVILHDRAVHFCGASALNKWERVQDNPDLMGRDWGSRWRRLYYTWCEDVTKHGFHPWVEIASTHKTGGYLFGADVWLASDARVHIIWTEYPINQRLRDQHFPEISRITSLKYAVLSEGKVVFRRTLAEGGEGISKIIPNGARFHVTPDERLFVVYCVTGTDAEGKPVQDNRLMEVFPDGEIGQPVAVPMKHPMGGFLGFFTATIRGGSAPSNTLDLLGHRLDSPSKISYARIKLW